VKNATWILGLPFLAVSLAACSGGAAGLGASSSASSSAGSSSSSTAANGTSMTTPLGQVAAARLLMQGTFGATPDTVNSTAAQSYSQWFAGQARATPSLTLASINSNENTDWSPAWFYNVVQGNDQLRQRMAFALSQIFVISGNGEPLGENQHNQALAYYYDTLVNDALGNFRQLLQDVTLSPGMGEFLSMMRSDKPNPATGVHADENYAREVMQLFTIGLYLLNPDGSTQNDSSGNPLPTYQLTDVVNLANAFTGWSSAPVPGSGHTGDLAWQYDTNETTPMVAYEDHHDTDAKTIIGGVSLPAGQPTAADLKTALDTLFNHPNVGPFIGKQLIQRLVTSNPSPAYVQRVTQIFNNDGTGTRGNLLAVAEAILTDPEAIAAGTSKSYGKLREPLLRVTALWRAFNAYAYNSGKQENDPELLLYANQLFNEYPLYSPSVFNFYRPDYQLTGPLTAAGMVAPEFQITNEATLVYTGNFLQQYAYQYVDSTGTAYAGPDYNAVSALQPTSVVLHTAEWEPLAANPTNLIAQLNLVLMANQMSAPMQGALLGYANSLPAGTPAATVVAQTAELVVSSPQFAVQR